MTQYFSKLVDDRKNSKQIWRAINDLTNKNKQPQQTINISPQTLNLHFSTVAERVISNDKSPENDLVQLRQFCESKHVQTPLKIPYMHVAEALKPSTILNKTTLEV
jgi:hypothetical protein